MTRAIVESLLQYANDSICSVTRPRRHTTYVSYTDRDACHRSYDAFADISACEFVSNMPSCGDFVNIFNYLKFMVCKLEIPPTFFGAVLISVFTVLLIGCFATFLYLISTHFILPNVIHVSQYVRVPEYDYGFTSIAIILTAPDVVWVMQECHRYSQNGTLIYAHMLGKSFTTYVVGLGVICLRGQTKLPGAQFVLHTFITMIAFIAATAVLHIKFMNDRSSMADQANINIRAVAFVFTVIYVANISYQVLTKRRYGRRRSKLERAPEIPHFEERSGWTQFWQALNAFKHMHRRKWVIGILSPLWVLAALQIPVIDKRRPMNGWCKYLTCMNIMLYPWQIYFMKNIHSKAMFIFSVIFAFVFMMATVIKTKASSPPKFQGFYAILGIIIGLSSYNLIGCELETILWQVCSYVYNIPSDIIMLTGFVFNYLLNVAIFGYELVKRGYGNLACGVVVGIVLNQAFMVLPIVVHQYCSKIQNFVVISANALTCLTFILVVFSIMVFALSSTNFELRPAHGVFLFMVYGIFLVFLTLSSFEVIHPYGAYHTVSADLAMEISEWA